MECGKVTPDNVLLTCEQGNFINKTAGSQNRPPLPSLTGDNGVLYPANG